MGDVRVVCCEIMSNTSRSRIFHDYMMVEIGWKISSYEILFRAHCVSFLTTFGTLHVGGLYASFLHILWLYVVRFL